MLNQASGIESFILDSEIVAIDPNAESLQSFQDLSGRARKDVKIEDVSIPVCVFAFDLMSLNGEVCIELEIRLSTCFTSRSHYCTRHSDVVVIFSGPHSYHLSRKTSGLPSLRTSRAVKVPLEGLE
jgi:hypothetical protein